MGNTGKAAAAAALWAATAATMAQSNVNIYGVMDVGYHRNSNVQSGVVNRLETRHEPSYIGFRGAEDLGGGLEATFQLEGSIPVDSGNFTSFNRYSILGLRSKQWGTLTLGRQYDTIIDLVGVDPPRFNSVTAVHTGNWDRSSGTFVNNSIKYRSPTVGGFNGSLLYVLKEDGTSAANTGKAHGASATYQHGPLRVSASYLRIDGVTHRPFNDFGVRSLFGQAFATTAANIVTNDKIWGIGAYYDFSGFRALGNYTQTKAKAATTGRTEEVKAVSAGLVYNATGTGFRPSIGVNRSSMGAADWTTVYGIVDYYLSRRTDVYVRVVSNKASGPAQAALYLEGPSSTRSQTVVGVGVTHRF